jgi:class 3 adenylate cyclase
VIDQASIDAGSAAYRGFLFSDVRGFTAYAERHGNVAAAAMVARFLELARKAIATHEGAEIKTEGDAIHAVFPSASGAVMCGLEIVDAAGELSERQPQLALDLGVGVHAGEAIETAEGYIGTAVNVAARLCAAARPGEVLVSATVKAITQTSIPVGFIARGRLRLKGIREPVEAFGVTRDLTAPAARVLPRLGMLLTAGGVAGAVLILAMVIGISLGAGTGAANPSPSVAASVQPAAPSARPVAIGGLSLGTYASTAFEPKVTFNIGDQGWAASRDVPGILGLVREVSPRGNVFFLRVDDIVQSPCGPGPDDNGTRPAASNLLDDLDALDHISLADRKPAEIGGFEGEQADVLVADGALAACGGLAGADVAVFMAGGEVWGASSGERFRLISVAVGAEPVTILVSADWTRTPAVQEVEDLFRVSQQILDSVTF